MRPGNLFIILIFLWSFSATILFFIPGSLVWWLAAGGALIILAATDLMIGKLQPDRRIDVAIDRNARDVFSVGIPVELKYVIKCSGQKIPRYIRIFEELPGCVLAAPYPIRVGRTSGTSGKEILREVTWTPKRRGPWVSKGFKLEYPSPLGFFLFLRSLSAPHKFIVVPDIGLFSSTRDEAFEYQRELPGQIPVRLRGEGTDFKELRDYLPGDSVRHIDWRATSRRTHPVLRTFQEDRDQQLLIILDGGYRLHQKDGEGLQFDKALQAALRLSYVALDHGDNVGMYAYGSQDRWIPPGKGRSHFWSLMRGMYDFESAPVATSPSTALERVLGRLNRRTLLIFITNLREEDGEVVSWMLPLVRGRHLIMAVTLQEEGTRGPAKVESLDEALLYGASTLYREQRIRLRRQWEKQGILTLDARPDQVSGKVINRYLALKGAGIL